ncbi:MAG: hypothetical protein VW443_00485 [Pseudomonadales bacterium]
MAEPRIYDIIEGTKPKNTEPTHVDSDGVTRPGAADLRKTLTKELTNDIDGAWRDDLATKEKRNRYSGNSPHLSEPYSNLETLAMQALRRYGDMHPGTVDGEVMLMFLEFANMIIEDLRSHPYWENAEIDYYVHMQEWREVPDTIMVAGLLYHYSIQQQSNKIEAYGPLYFKTTNRVLYNRKYGSGKIQVQPWDNKQT